MDESLKFTGFDDEKNVRIVEITGKRFFVASLFLPQLSSEKDSPHPLVKSFIEECLGD